MSERKVLTYLGIILGVDGLLLQFKLSYWLILIDVGLVIGCEAVWRLENWIFSAHHLWLDRLFYKFSKRTYPFVILNKNIEYRILSQDQGTFESNVHIQMKKDDYIKFDAKYNWEQAEDIGFELLDTQHFNCERTEECYSTRVDIASHNQFPKKSVADLGFRLNNLVITNLVKHSFLSIRIRYKLKVLRLTAYVSPDLNPIKGELIIKDALGNQIKNPIPIPYENGKFEQIIHYPRKGRTYYIKWGYEKA